MYDFITTRSKPGTAKSGNSSTPIWTIFCWRFKLTMFTRMWKTANISMTQAVFPKIIHFTAQQTKRFWARWKTRWTERQLLSVFALGQKFTQSRQRSKTSKVERREKECCEKRDKACALQRDAFQQKTTNWTCFTSKGMRFMGCGWTKSLWFTKSLFDSKRYIAENRIDTRAYGHWLTEELNTYISELLEVILSKEAQSLAWAHFVNSREQALWECW